MKFIPINRTIGLGKKWSEVWDKLDMKLIAAGNTKTINAAYEQLKPSVFYNMRTTNERDREEIYNDFFTNWCHYAEKFDPAKGTLYSWTLILQIQAEANYYKKKETKTRPLLTLDEPPPSNVNVKKELT